MGTRAEKERVRERGGGGNDSTARLTMAFARANIKPSRVRNVTVHTCETYDNTCTWSGSKARDESRGGREGEWVSESEARSESGWLTYHWQSYDLRRWKWHLTSRSPHRWLSLPSHRSTPPPPPPPSCSRWCNCAAVACSPSLHLASEGSRGVVCLRPFTLSPTPHQSLVSCRVHRPRGGHIWTCVRTPCGGDSAHPFGAVVPLPSCRRRSTRVALAFCHFFWGRWSLVLASLSLALVRSWRLRRPRSCGLEMQQLSLLQAVP